MSSAEAADWVLYGRMFADGYYDRSNIKYLQNNCARIWTKSVYPMFNGEYESKVIIAQMELFCDKSEWRFLEIYRYNSKGKFLSDVREPGERVPVSGPEMEKLFQAVCTERLLSTH